jgi:hypothetical protein
MRLRSAPAAALAVACTLAAPAAGAQGWAVQPDGRPTYTDTYTTTGVFFCAAPLVLGASCEASGNTLRLGSNGAFVTYQFNGLTQAVAATNQPQRVAFGTLVTTPSGAGGFTFPTTQMVNATAFSFRLGMRNSAGTELIAKRDYVVRGAPTEQPTSCCPDDLSAFIVQLPRAPGPITYPSVVFSNFTDLRLVSTPESRDISAQVGLVPEPSTFALGAAGLALVGAAARRRARG